MAVILLVSLAIPFASAGSAALPDNNNLYLETVNTPRFDDQGDGTYWFWFPDDAGLNTLHITDDYADSYGQITTTAEMSGSFYVTDTGGMKYKDDIILLLAVNGSVNDNFSMNLACNGYQWTPNASPHTPPLESEATYVKGCLNADFTKDDFLVYDGKNVKQNWKIYNTSDYPLYYGQDVSDTDNAFKLMFIDLNAGVLNADSLGYSTLKNGGSVKVSYEFQNLDDCYAAFNVYAYSKHPEVGHPELDNTTQWTNRMNDESGRTVSGYSVWSLFAPQVTSIAVSPETAVIAPNSTLQLSAVGLDQGGNEIPGLTFEWKNDNPMAGWIDSDGLYTTTHLGISNITASCENVTGTSQVVVTPVVSPIYVAGDGSGDYETISEAVTYAHEGTEIIVRNGTYTECVDIPRSLSIHSENGPDLTTLNLSTLPVNTGGFVLNADCVNISGFTITGASGDGDSEGFAVNFNEASDSILFNCWIVGNTDGVFFNSGENNTVGKNVIDCPESDDHFALRIKKNSGSNTIYQNSFVSGGLKTASGSSGNLWNTLDIYQYSFFDGQTTYQGSSQTGNYWSAYTGVSGETPGIGAVAYEIPGVGTDNYPLVAPIGNYTFGSAIPAGDTFYVGAGEDFSTIQSAVDAANAGYTIIVKDGTYAESVTIDKALTVTSENGADAAIIQSVGNRGVLISADGVVLNGMTVTNTTDDSNSGAIYLSDASGCVITNNTAGGDGVGIVLNGNSDNNQISENTVSLNSNKKRLFSIKSAECENNRIYENVFAKGKTPKDEGIGNVFNTPDVVENYVYEGHQCTSFFGNYWVDADKTDSDINGIADSPYSDGVTDNYPLVSSNLSEYYQNGDYTGDIVENVPLTVPECTFTGVPGEQSVVVDNSTGHASIFGNSILLAENGFTIVINTVSPPGGNTTVITGVVDSVNIFITPVATQFDGLGAVQAFIGVDLTGLPAGSELDSIVNKSVSADDLTKFKEIAAVSGLNSRDIAYTLRVVKSAGFDDYVEGAAVLMEVNSRWVDSHGGPSHVEIIRISDSGAGQVLETSYTGPVDGMYTFIASSPNGLSLFGLSSVTTLATSGGGSSGGNSQIAVAAQSDVNAGENVVFSFDESAIYRITLVAKEDVKEIMLTAKKGAMPDSAEAPSGDVYQYVGITMYKADPAQIEKATIRFTVDSAAFADGYDPSMTKLLYYNEEDGVWTELSTVNNGEENGSFEFFADSAKLGNFAIVLHNYVSSEGALEIIDEPEEPAVTNTDAPVSSESSGVSDESTWNIPPTESGSLFSGMFSVIGAIGIVSLMSFAAYRRKNE
ncbi:pectinesterase family protein [Methanogenium marinum]|uniref:Pectinesterase family protein n=1 Tax=Methanogenium marinum TaxID=348610 RepID=A0A9Q4KUX0_9EURY|nr:NosD domain-containing protein [Methanogenium marinum]MDE4908828.1 pectinesterase family protein [Methanogenium marinum]